MKSFLFIAPFWRDDIHVGTYRVERFIRWIDELNIKAVIVRSGNHYNKQYYSWGTVISVPDPLRHFLPLSSKHENESNNATNGRSKRNNDIIFTRFFTNFLKKYILSILLCPDQNILWTIKSICITIFTKEIRNIGAVLSSSPPESSHIAAFIYSTVLKKPLIVDMRDGWLDEPLKTHFLRLRVRKFIESLIEKLVLKKSSAIIVTSYNWKLLLIKRIPNLRHKVHVLTNAYPILKKAKMPTTKNSRKKGAELVYAGQFTASRSSQKPKYLLLPMLYNLASYKDIKGIITLMGRMTPYDLSEISDFRPKFETIGWSINIENPKGRAEMLDYIHKADGLLLLSASFAAIPSKLFEYIITRKPIFACTYANSSVYRLKKKYNYLFPFDFLNNIRPSPVFRAFFDSCHSKDSSPKIPIEFSEYFLFCKFQKILHTLNLIDVD